MLNPELAARIKACNGLYSVGDTSKYFSVSKSTVHGIWSGNRHTGVIAASEADNIISSRITPDVLIEDGTTLLQRGLTVVQAAAALGVSKTTMYDRLRAEGRYPIYIF